MDTTPSPKKALELKITFEDIPANVKCWFDYMQNVPMLMESPERNRMADDVCHDGGMVCGLWQASPYTWWKWQSDVTLTSYMELNEILEADEAEEEGAAPKRRAMTVKKKPATRKKPAASPTLHMANTPTTEEKKITDGWVKTLVNFENSPHGLALNRERNYVRSRIYHKLRVSLAKAGMQKTYLSPLVAEAMAQVALVLG